MTEGDNSEVRNIINRLEEEEYNDGEFSCCCCNKCWAIKCKCLPVVCTCDCMSVCKADKEIDKAEDEIKRRDYLHKKWSINGCQLLYCNFIQGILQKHLGNGIATYFLMLRYLFIWVMVMLFVGVVCTAASFYTMHDNVNPATPVCKADYKAYYMCPLCDKHCSFWYLKQAINTDLCTRHFRLIFDNPIVWAFTFLMIFSAFIVTILMIFHSIHKKKVKETNSNPVSRKGQKKRKDSDSEEIQTRNDCCYICCESESCGTIVCDYCFITASCCRCCSFFGQIVWMIFSCFMILGFFFVFIILSLVLEREVRRGLVNKYHTSRFLTLILATVPVALIQTTVNALVKRLYRVLLRSCYCLRSVNSCTIEFVTILIPNMVISYSPIIYRIIFFGNFVGDPEDGYLRFVNDIRLQHCPEYGCMDIGVYTFLGILSFAVSPLWKIVSKMLVVRMMCYTNSSEGNSSSSFVKRFKDCCIMCLQGSGVMCLKLSKISKTNHMIENYMDLLMIYGYVIFFIVANGAVPLLAAVVTIPLIARCKANDYVLWNDEEKVKERKYDFSLKSLKYFFLIFTVLSTFTNVAIFIPNSRFIQHISYSRTVGHNKALLNFTGYLDEVLPKHSIATLVDNGFFPNPEALNLPLLYPNGKQVRNSNGEPILYLPFIDFQCLKRLYPSVGQNFTAKGLTDFINQYSNYKYKLDCFNATATCRSRGFLKSSDNARILSMTRKLFAITAVVPAITLVVFYFVIPLIRCYEYMK